MVVFIRPPAAIQLMQVCSSAIATTTPESLPQSGACPASPTWTPSERCRGQNAASFIAQTLGTYPSKEPVCLCCPLHPMAPRLMASALLPTRPEQGCLPWNSPVCRPVRSGCQSLITRCSRTQNSLGPEVLLTGCLSLVRGRF